MTEEPVIGDLLKDIVHAKRKAESLGLTFLGDLLGMAFMEAALNLDGDPRDERRTGDLERLLRMKAAVAMAEMGGNVTPFPGGR